MKTFLKIFLIIVVIASVLGGGYYVYDQYFSKSDGRDALTLIPEDAIFVVETSNLTEGWTAVSDSKIWSHLLQNEYFKDINEYVDMIDSYLKENSAVNLVLSDRKLLLSAHMISGVDWDFLYVVDLQSASAIGGGLDKALAFIEGYNVNVREFKGEKIIELVNETDPKDVVYMANVDNLLVVSFVGALIEKAINQKDDLHWKNNAFFQEVSTDLSSRKLMKFYFNYAQLNAFSQSFLDAEEEMLKELGLSLRFSGFDVNLENERLSFEGFTSMDSVASYIKALAGVAPGKMRAYELLSDQTAFYLSMNFDSYPDFYQKLTDQYRTGNAEDMDDIDKNVKMLEKLLKIDLNEDFFSWIGHEIAFAKLRPKNSARIEDVVVAIHALDIDKAKAGMEHITSQIRKRSPLKFDVIEYKNYSINYLERKGLFKMFFGKLFGALEKPYFTFIEDYLVMSNSKETLMEVIDDYMKGSVLSHNVDFMDFKDEFDVKSSVSMFIQMPKIYAIMYSYGNDEKRESLKANKDLVLSFARIGFQLVSEGGMLTTRFIADHDPNAPLDDELEKFEKEASDNLFNEEYDSLQFKIELSEELLSEDKQYKAYYADSTTIMYEGTILKGKVTGLWRSYYESGNLKSSINYDDGYVDGIAYFYYDDAKGTKKAEVNFDKDVIVDEYREFFDNGAQKAKLEYDEGVLHGDAEFYYPNGTLKIEGKYKRGQKKGRWKSYDERGKLISKERM